MLLTKEKKENWAFDSVILLLNFGIQPEDLNAIQKDPTNFIRPINENYQTAHTHTHTHDATIKNRQIAHQSTLCALCSFHIIS